MNPHCALLQSDDIQAVVGDSNRNGMGGQQYCGLWSLTSRHRPFNAFGNSYAGLLPGELRGPTRMPELLQVDDATCTLSRRANDAYPVDVQADYRLSAPCYIDHSLSLTDRKDVRRDSCDFREVSWCCYMNSPEDPRLHFRSRGEWFSYISPTHGVGSNIAPAHVPDSELEVWPQHRADGSHSVPFHWDRIERRFDEPFYYGRLGDMVLILIFDQPDWLRFFCSPSGGGPSLLPDRTCPAWDFEWVIPPADYEVGRTYTFKVRLVYKPFVSRDDVLTEYRSARASQSRDSA
jgi:hypothetical protein